MRSAAQVAKYDRFRVNGIYGVALRRCVWLTALAALIGAVPATAHAGTNFTFVPDPVQPSLPLGSTLATVGELTSGTAPDLVVIDRETESVGVMLGNGSGTFGSPTWFPLAGRPDAVSVADFNNDGDPDLLVSLEPLVPSPHHGPEPAMVQILSGDGQGGFTVEPAINLPEAGPTYVGDFTGDGDEDVVVAPNGCTAGGNLDKYYMLLGDGHGDLTPGPVYESSRAGGCYFLVGDFTGRGRDDLVTKPESPGEEEAIVVLPGEPDGSFGPPIVTPVPQLATHGAFLAGAADLEPGGPLDLVLRSFEEPTGQVEVFRGNGEGSFSEVGAFPSEQPHYSFWVALGEFEGRGETDIVTVGSQLSVLANDGLDAFTPAYTTPLGTVQSAAYVADVNGDGRPDLIVGWNTIQIFLNEQVAPPVGPPIDPPAASQPIAPSLRDLRESARRWHEGSTRGNSNRKKALSDHTTFSFSLSEQATVSLSFTHYTTGRSVHGTCMTRSTADVYHKACKRTLPDGTLTFAGHSGSNAITFAGHISRSKTLEPGTYTVTVTATNIAGPSNPERLGFTIVS